MSSLNFTITATAAEFTDFANRLGYQDFNLDAEPNPETRPEFLQRILKEKVAEVFYTPFVTEIQAQINTSRDAEKETMKTVVRDRVGVNYVA
jgi:hypothetical protein